MKYPKFLQDKGTIGFVAPSFGCNIEPYKTAFENAQRKFKEMGYGIDIGPNCYAGNGVGISNTPEKCASEINGYYPSGKNDVLISCGGGELMCEVLNYIDFQALQKAEPKWYMGFSDNTNLTFLLTTLCDTASIYGPCAAAYGMEPWHESVQDAFDLIRGKKLSMKGYDMWEKESLKDEDHPLVSYNLTERRVIHGYPEKFNMKGRLIGGCMDCLVNILGTRFDKVSDFLERYKADGFIWFIESCDLNVMSIRRAMWQMDAAGWFKYVKGFMIGRPLQFGQEMFGLDQYEAVLGIIGKYNVPVVMDVDLGHLSPMMPIICGSIGEVTVNNQDMEVRMNLI
ncbi:MAG: S66 peptidase family protein [Coprococcus sp.]